MDEKISGYLDSLEEQDRAEEPDDTPPPSAAELREKTKSLQERKAKYQALQQGLKARGAKQGC